MIRDEYLKQKKEKSLTAKEMIKIREMGERTFYSNRIRDLTAKLNAISISLKVVAVFIFLGIAMLILSIIMENGFTDSLILPIIVTAVFIVLTILVLVIYVPMQKKKIEKSKERIEELRIEQMQKQQAIYKAMNK